MSCFLLYEPERLRDRSVMKFLRFLRKFSGNVRRRVANVVRGSPHFGIIPNQMIRLIDQRAEYDQRRGIFGGIFAGIERGIYAPSKRFFLVKPLPIIAELRNVDLELFQEAQLSRFAASKAASAVFLARSVKVSMFFFRFSPKSSMSLSVPCNI